jgi:hypothetical protein
MNANATNAIAIAIIIIILRIHQSCSCKTWKRSKEKVKNGRVRLLERKKKKLVTSCGVRGPNYLRHPTNKFFMS